MSITFIAWGLTSVSGLPIGIAADILDERTVFIGLGVLVCGATVLLGLWERAISAGEASEKKQKMLAQV